MIRSYLSGMFWGAVVAGTGLAVVSQVAPLPASGPVEPLVEAPAPDSAAPEPAPLPAAPEAEPAPEILQKGPLTEEEPDVGAEESAGDGDGTLADDAAQAPAAEGESATPSPAAGVTSEAPAAPLAPAAAAEGDALASPQAEAAPGVVPADEPAAPSAEAVPEVQGEPPAAPVEEALLQPDPAPLADPAPALIAPEEPVVIAPEPAPGLASDGGIDMAVPEVETDRLPRIGDAEEGAGDAAPDPGVLAVTGTTPLELFAAQFDNPEAKPLFSIILIDRGTSAEDRANLAALPFPVTFALDPLAADSAEAARVYRAAGQEVAMLAAGIPAGATAADMEQTFQALDIALPEAVVVLDDAAAGFQDKPELARQAVPIVAAQGRGLVTYDRGLNTADQVARREGVPAAVIFRVLDSEGESIPKMRNYLDRAAFKAAQEGRVLVIGTTKPETVAAILEWTVEGRASTVALAPVSAVLEATPKP